MQISHKIRYLVSAILALVSLFVLMVVAMSNPEWTPKILLIIGLLVISTASGATVATDALRGHPKPRRPR
jgi:hypothetical protein